MSMYDSYRKLASEMEGELFTDRSHRLLYATDASIYREIPVAVALPASIADIKRLVYFSRQNKTTLIPRGAGTSLAGQVVGDGLVVDISRHFNKVLEINPDERWVRVQTGVVLDELNMELAKYRLFFAPETSTSSRCMIGGMIGNNSCGSHSLIYGSTRDHLLAVRAVLSDGSDVEFSSLTDKGFLEKTKEDSLEGRIYKNIYDLLSVAENQQEIKSGFPDPLVKRRNTGYAIDRLLEQTPFTRNGNPFNFASLIAGSEGTLAFITEAKLNLIPLPPPSKGLLCVHLNTLEEALEANLICLKKNPSAVELMDSTILECTKSNIEQRKNRFFVSGDPGAILIIEFQGQTDGEVVESAAALEKDLRAAGLGYHFPLVTGKDIGKVWALRKSGLGVLSNIPGDARALSVIEDTAVRPDLLPSYIHDIKLLLEKHGLSCVFHAHIGTGELHFRPVINLKNESGIALMKELANETAILVKKYRGSLSGEHGDGRVRSGFIPVIIGDKNYELIKQIKKTWDPEGVFNRGKITDPRPFTTSLRYIPSVRSSRFSDIFDYSPAAGMLAHAELCNGSGDCRKSAVMGGTMCPSYMGSQDEYKTTRGRANLLREYLTIRNNPFSPSAREVYNILDYCLSCKGCKSECPSNVDMAKLKAEFLQHYFDIHGIPVRSWLISRMPDIYRIASLFPRLFNFMAGNVFTGSIIKGIMGFSAKRRIPSIAPQSLASRIKTIKSSEGRGQVSLPVNHDTGVNGKPAGKSLYLFIDEFSNFTDVSAGFAAYALLTGLGYNVLTVKGPESGRTSISKGLIRRAKKIAEANVMLYSGLINGDVPLVGIEPSSILTFRDEYAELTGKPVREKAVALAANCYMIEEFIAHEFSAGNISSDSFTKESRKILYHGHCQQKAIASTSPVITILNIPENYTATEIASGCCGMAGSFGFEKRHYDLSMNIGEQVLFPAIRKADNNTIISASGTSCRQQILDGTSRKAMHPVEVLYDAFIK